MQEEKIHIVEKVFDGLMSHLNCKTLRDLASILDMNEGTLNAWKSRGKIAKPEKISAKCKGVSLDWLLTGEGPMFPGQTERRPPNAVRDHKQSTEAEPIDIESLLNKTRRVLSSQTIYRKALESNIIAFDRGVGMEDEVGALHGKIDQMAADMAELKAMFMQQDQKKSVQAA